MWSCIDNIVYYCCCCCCCSSLRWCRIICRKKEEEKKETKNMRIEYIIYKDRPYDSMVKLKRIIIIIIIIINIIFVRFVVHSFHFLSLSHSLLSLAYVCAYTHTLLLFSRRVSQRANEQTEDRWRKNQRKREEKVLFG
jgi:hypothetical protein